MPITPATGSDLDWVADLQRELFGTTAVPLAILRDWYAANPNGFQIVRAGEERIGHFDVLPVKAGPLQQFTAGTIEERALRGSDLHSPNEREQVRDLYLESVIVLGASKAVHDAAVEEALRSLPPILASLGDPARLRFLYAVAATPAGDRFLRRIGFEQIAPATERVDRMPLYRLALPLAVIGLAPSSLPRTPNEECR
jgi:hypothetical protein